jgi:hypothetical protein
MLARGVPLLYKVGHQKACRSEELPEKFLRDFSLYQISLKKKEVF